MATSKAKAKRTVPPEFEAGRIHNSEEARRRSLSIPRDGEGSAVPTEGDLIRYGYRRINDPRTDPRLKLRYWERIGEWLHLWGPKAEKRKPQQPVPFDIEGDEANLP